MWAARFLIGRLAAVTRRRHVTPARRSGIAGLALAALIGFAAPPASAQDADRVPPALDIFKRVVLDPTTYGPAIVSYEAHHLDWKSSQVFFQHGFVEQNPEFTVSGRPDDTPISYAAGNRRILGTSLVGLRTSLIHNVTESVVERVLITRYPEHRKVWRALGWIERISLATYWSYHESAVHFRQWQRNEQLARQLGYK